jgi:hypothetical protein
LENCKKVLYVEALKAIYGMLKAALLWYKTFRKDLKDIGFIFNLYDPCVANKSVQGSQQMIVFHVDDLKPSHKMKAANAKFEKWLNSKYCKHRKVTVTRDKVYVENMMNDFPVQLGKTLQRRQPETTYST